MALVTVFVEQIFVIFNFSIMSLHMYLFSLFIFNVAFYPDKLFQSYWSFMLLEPVHNTDEAKREDN